MYITITPTLNELLISVASANIYLFYVHTTTTYYISIYRTMYIYVQIIKRDRLHFLFYIVLLVYLLCRSNIQECKDYIQIKLSYTSIVH